MVVYFLSLCPHFIRWLLGGGGSSNPSLHLFLSHLLLVCHLLCGGDGFGDPSHILLSSGRVYPILDSSEDLPTSLQLPWRPVRGLALSLQPLHLPGNPSPRGKMISCFSFWTGWRPLLCGISLFISSGTGWIFASLPDYLIAQILWNSSICPPSLVHMLHLFHDALPSLQLPILLIHLVQSVASIVPHP